MEEGPGNNKKAMSMQAYIDYYNIVGNADGGKLFTNEQYEEYKSNMKKNSGNRVYTSWRNTKGNDCKMIGPASTCLCGHRYKDHNYINPIDKKVHCKVNKCSCPCFYSVPVHGSNDFKCLCKVSYLKHDPITKKCPKGKTGSATGRFASTWSCSCGYKFMDHITVFETREERIELGKPVDDMNRMIGEIGVITGENPSPGIGGGTDFQVQIDALGSLEHQMKAKGATLPKGTGMTKGNVPQKGNVMQKQTLPQTQKVEQDHYETHYQSHMQGGYDTTYSNPPSKRLADLNQKISMEKEINAYQTTHSDISGRTGMSVPASQQSISQQPGNSALDLYYTPHTYARVRINIRKPSKY